MGTTIAFEAKFEVVCKCGEMLSIVFESSGPKRTANWYEEKLKAVVEPCECCLFKAQDLAIRGWTDDDLAKLGLERPGAQTRDEPEPQGESLEEERR